MDDKFKSQLAEVFNQAFEDVVLPNIVNLDQRMTGLELRISELESDIKLLKVTVEKIDRKLDIFSDKVTQHEVKLKLN